MTIIIILIILAVGLAATCTICACVLSGRISKEERENDDNPYNVW